MASKVSISLLGEVCQSLPSDTIFDFEPVPGEDMDYGAGHAGLDESFELERVPSSWVIAAGLLLDLSGGDLA